jgi:hypothetical protein
MSPSFVKWAGKQLKLFRDRIEAHRRRERFARLLRVNPELRARAEAHHRQQMGHKPSRAAWKAMREAMNAELMKELHHG